MRISAEIDGQWIGFWIGAAGSQKSLGQIAPDQIGGRSPFKMQAMGMEEPNRFDFRSDLLATVIRSGNPDGQDALQLHDAPIRRQGIDQVQQRKAPEGQRVEGDIVLDDEGMIDALAHDVLQGPEVGNGDAILYRGDFLGALAGGVKMKSESGGSSSGKPLKRELEARQ